MARSSVSTVAANHSFKDQLFRRGEPCFYAFDLLMLEGKDQRNERLIDRKQELRRMLSRVRPTSPFKYDHQR